ncbi:hypothetical protein [Pseudomonas sp. C2B4]|uniref:hypothetical protein n=1 Tax=Pseudomonas sp. C2B4 TaxID=2735270 RepID=UPI001586DCF8|nr:hypothetical protein [Pseudomonas sp. C2B4]NUU36895.1 hypothetical protein [Pseudomonas sp. C2B4]
MHYASGVHPQGMEMRLITILVPPGIAGCTRGLKGMWSSAPGVATPRGEGELQATGQVNEGPVSPMPSCVAVCFTAVPSKISRVRP